MRVVLPPTEAIILSSWLILIDLAPPLKTFDWSGSVKVHSNFDGVSEPATSDALILAIKGLPSFMMPVDLNPIGDVSGISTAPPITAPPSEVN